MQRENSEYVKIHGIDMRIDAIMPGIYYLDNDDILYIAKPGESLYQSISFGIFLVFTNKHLREKTDFSVCVAHNDRYIITLETAAKFIDDFCSVTKAN